MSIDADQTGAKARRWGSPVGARAAAIALLGLVVLAVYAIGVRPYVVALSAAVDEARASEDAIERYHRVLATRSEIEASIEAMSAALEAQDVVMAPTPEAEATARLQQLLTELVDANGGGARSIRVLPSESVGSFEKIALQIDLQASTDDLSALLMALDAQSPRLFVQNGTIRAASSTPPASQASAASRAAIKLDVYAFMRAPAS